MDMSIDTLEKRKTLSEVIEKDCESYNIRYMCNKDLLEDIDNEDLETCLEDNEKVLELFKTTINLWKYEIKQNEEREKIINEYKKIVDLQEANMQTYQKEIELLKVKLAQKGERI